jgi:hypothetical protein
LIVVALFSAVVVFCSLVIHAWVSLQWLMVPWLLVQWLMHGSLAVGAIVGAVVVLSSFGVGVLGV